MLGLFKLENISIHFNSTVFEFVSKFFSTNHQSTVNKVKKITFQCFEVKIRV